MFHETKEYFLNLFKEKKKMRKEKLNHVEETHTFHKNIEVNLTNLKGILGKSDDVVFREFQISVHNPIKVFICFVNGLVNTEVINEFIVKPLMEYLPHDTYDNDGVYPNLIKAVKDHTLSVADLKEAQSMNQVINAILSGETALFIDGNQSAILISVQGFESRSVEEPATETTVRGPREGFVENIQVNTALIRRKIKNPNLIFEKLTLGQQTSTSIGIIYIDGIANPKIIQEVKHRLNRIDTDSILGSGYAEQFIKDHPLSPFPTIGNSEKPDIIAGKLLEGRVAILCDGTPVVLTIPYLFIESLQSVEDYYTDFFLASFRRIIRTSAFFATIVTPALYVAVTTYHPGMIPTILLVTMAASHEGTPFTAFLEAIIMGVTFEFITEAGIKMPRPIGQAVSIVGALVIGQAAVQAGIVSSPMVIVMAFTGISSFIIPPLNTVIILFRLIFLILGASLGLYGILIGFFILFTHICSLRSFGTPYFAPIAPMIWKELKDSVIRIPLWLLKSRPQSITWKHTQRQGSSLKPEPPTSNQDGEER